MKELSIEQKAKAYDEAIKKAKEFKNNPFAGYDDADYDGADLLSSLFPELIENKEESEDEKIRKALIDYFSDFNLQTFAGLEPKKILAWLEKQGESTDINPSEFDLRLNKLLKQFETLPKKELVNCLSFYLNVVQNDGTYREEKRGEQKPTDKTEPKFKNGQWIVWQNKCYKVNYNGCGYELIDQNGLSTSLEYVTVDENAHLWTIQDAKGGDVLADRDKAILLFRGIGNNEWSDAIDYYALLETNLDNRFSLQEGDAYWGKVDYCDLCPSTKEQRELLFQKMKEAGYEWEADKKELKKVEQKAAENKELSEFDKAVGVSIGTWNPKTPEQIQSVKAVSKRLLKLAKKQINDEHTPAWSEKDERHLNNIINRTVAYGDSSIYGLIKDDIAWLRSLRPQSQWKPSDEQIEVLEWSLHNWTDKTKEILESLYEQLKKLRKE